VVHDGKGIGMHRRRWRCPCRAVRGLLGTIYGQLAAVLLTLFGAFAALVFVPGEAPTSAAVLTSVGVVLFLALMAGWLLTRPLRALLRSVTDLRESDYRQPLPPRPGPGPASAEVSGIERACREMAERVARGAGTRGQAEARVQALLAGMSREMQEPLVAVQTALLRLSGREGSLSGHARQAVLDSALRSTERALRLAGEADGLARLYAPAARPRSEPFALEALAQNVVQRLRPQAGRLGVDLEVRAPSGLPLVTADHDLVDEGLFRLVDHAVRHCPAGARVRVTLQEEGDGVRALVRGIEADLPSESRPGALGPTPGAGPAPTTGDGLALAIARRVVELHGGELKVAAAPGMHASYAFTLPRAAAAADDRPVPS